MEVSYSPRFIRLMNALSNALQEEVIEKVESFRDEKNHKNLKVHKLRGHLKEQHSFWVNYRIRVIFVYLPTKKKEAYLLTVGDHEVYD